MEENENTTNEIDTTEQVPGTVLTKKGIRLIAKILGSETVLKITRAAVGTGTIPEGVEAREMEDLSCFKKDGKISRVGKVDGENQVNIAIQVNSIGVDENFVITEAGIFAEDPDEGEILYCYLDMTEDPQLVYHSRNAISKMVEITMAIIVATTDQVYVEINPGSLVSIEDLKNFKEEVKVDIDVRFEDLRKLIGDLSKLRTEKKCCLVDAINEIVDVIRPLTEYGYMTNRDVDDIIAGIYSDDLDWVSILDVMSERDVDAIIAGTYVETDDDDETVLMDEDIDMIIAGTYIDDPADIDDDPGGVTDQEIDQIINDAFSEEE